MKKNLLAVAAVLLAAVLAAPTLSSGADDSSAKPAADGANKFYGPVTAVDTTAKTFTVNDQIFTITAESQVTKGTNNATLADAVVGEPARGSYVKGADGKLEVTKVRFGKKVGGKAGGKTGGKKKKDAGESSGTSTNAPAAASQN
jgi:hypothetical protein